MGITGMDNWSLLVAMFPSSGVYYSQVMGVRAVVGVKCTVVRDGYGEFSYNRTGGFILLGYHGGSLISYIRFGWS